ncbi:MAG: DUF3179 domain-containing (seleno)protein [Cyclobacteriaceae bacterium]
MKMLFYIGLPGLALFEILNVYFIMPMPGSQQFNSIDVAYFLYTYRWFFRIVFGLMILGGSVSAFSIKKKWIPIVALLPVLAIAYTFNFRMTADHMFLQPETIVFKSRAENTLTDGSLVVAVSHNMEAKAYPIRYIQYHHQVRDTIAGRHIMVTYCNVCRTGRVFEPVVDGKLESFRLVGMDHFNAMFEDETTKSWWRQATGEAVTGPLKGKALAEVESNQYTLNKFFSLHPFGKVMQAEAASQESYDTLGRFEKGKSEGKLTRTDSLSWKDKSWVLGIQIDGKSKAYDWIQLKELKVLNDRVGNTPIVIAIVSDEQSFAAFKRDNDKHFILRNDSLIGSQKSYDLLGRSTDGSNLQPIKIYQEFWHSWKQFHPDTEVYR